MNRMKTIQARRLGFFSEIPKVCIFEGNRSILVREDGSVEQIERTVAKVDIQINKTEIEEMPPQKVLEKFDEAAEGIAIQQAKSFFSEIDKAVEKVGNVVDCGGKTLSVEHFFRMIDMIWIEFDSDGKPHLPEPVGDPRGREAIKQILSDIESDPVMRKRFDELLERKKEEWRARESNRKLVG